MLFLLQKANCLTDFPSSAHSTPNTQSLYSQGRWLPFFLAEQNQADLTTDSDIMIAMIQSAPFED